jgi:hypothetical protein
MEAARCPGCGASIEARWCAHCGQRAPAPDDLSARRFFGGLWDEATELDSRTWRTLRAFLIPGELSRATFARQQQRYLPPLRLYLIVSGIFFLLAWDVYQGAVTDTLRTSASGQSAAIVALLDDPVATDRIADLTAWFRFGAVLVFGLGLAALFWTRRMPLGAHLVFATHYYCADFLLFSLLAIPLAAMPELRSAAGWGVATGVGIVVLQVYLILALRRAYLVGWPGAIARGLGLTVLDVLLSSMSTQLAVVVVSLTR